MSATEATPRPVIEYKSPTGESSHLYHVFINEDMDDEQRRRLVELIRGCDDVIAASYIVDTDNQFAVVYAHSQDMGMNKLLYSAWAQVKKV